MLAFLALGLTFVWWMKAVPPRAAAQSIPALPADAHSLSLSADGRFLAFLSAEALTEDDDNGATDAFVLDRLTGTVELVSRSTTGAPGNAPIEEALISADGRFIAFLTTATTLVPDGDSSAEQPIRHLYLRDRLTGLTERLSVNDRGEPANANVRGLALSANGRYAVFQSLADNLVREDTNQAADLFLRDRWTGHTLRLSVSSRGAQANGPSGEVFALSGDGRITAYTSQATNLAIAIDTAPRIYRYHRVLAQTSYHNLPVDDRQRQILQLALSYDGEHLAALTLADESEYEVLLFATDANLPQTLTTFPLPAESPGVTPKIALSGDGLTLWLLTPEGEVQRYDLESGERAAPLSGKAREIALAAGGETLAYLPLESDAPPQFYAPGGDEFGYTLSGRVTDATGYPLALVTIHRSDGGKTRTDPNGYFYFSGLPAGEITLTPEKEGYRFEPESLTLEINGDRADLHFTAYLDQVLEEARADLGMPYSFDRGESGPFHGYAAGYCTDLVLDAYTFGADYDIQFALEQDFRANPEHIYRWRNARDAYDMWRYFIYSGQMLPHAAPYLPGDIVFFDWSEDGEIDHVAIVSEITADNRPRMMYDASGKINSNPSGLAAELPWEPFHERTVRGHARWSGAYEPVIPQFPTGDYLQVAVGSSGLRARLLTADGAAISQEERQIPGGVFFDLGWEEDFSIAAPRALGETFTLEVHNPTDAPVSFVLLAQTLQEGRVTARWEHSDQLAPGETLAFPLQLTTDEQDRLSLSAPTLDGQ
ncbi:MAG: DUF1287 domain-containing protein [Anaerolineae bacterium]|nr:MAG: DUF1287 domain-containing protein [Anaerolineae bacterium]